MIRKTRSSATGGKAIRGYFAVRPWPPIYRVLRVHCLEIVNKTERGTFECRRFVLSPPRSACSWPCIFCQSIEKSSCLARKPKEVTDSRLYQRRTAGQKRDNFRMDRGRRCKLCRHYLLNRKRK